MIIIFTTDSDVSTSEVIKWLNYDGVKWIRYNDFYQNGFIDLFPISISDNYQTDIQSVWYRRNPIFNHIEKLSLNLNNLPEELRTTLIRHISKEYSQIFKTLSETYLNKVFKLNSPINSNFEKYKQILIAQECQLKVPDSYIISDKNKLENIIKKHKKVAIKPISESIHINYKGENYMSYTSVLTFDDLATIKSAKIHPLLIQEYIEKEVEIRTFYLCGKFYSMAIFSQSDEQTAIDFRKYNFDKSNRFVPFKLPLEIESKLHKFMNKANLNCGSFDLILTPQKEIYFLEVNPVGQFGMVSKPCNYYLEREISNILQKKQ